MPRFIALLRAINVGGHTVKMDRLRDCSRSSGSRPSRRFIASGNVIFESGARNGQSLERKIAQHLEQSLGYAVIPSSVPAPSSPRWRGTSRSPPPSWRPRGVSLYVAFLPSPPTAEPRRAGCWLSVPTGDDFISMGARSTGCGRGR